MTGPEWAGSNRVLLVEGRLHAGSGTAATAVLIVDDTIAWVGDEEGADRLRDSADQVVRLGGRLVTPGFVDAHIHATATGLCLTGLDLSETRSLSEALDLVSLRARELRGGVILGHGWDETRWPERRAPTRAEIDRATWGSVVYLSRVDVHSAVVSSALAAGLPDLRGRSGFDATGPLTRDAHHAARTAALAMIGAAERRSAQSATRQHCAELGIVAVQEMAGPAISGEEDLRGLLALAGEVPGPVVLGYWGELASAGGLERARDLGAHGVAGDLFVDGAIGSRTAGMRSPYADDHTCGAIYLTSGEIADHVEAATRAGMQAGFHVIGDAATDEVIAGFREAADRVGESELRARHHRVEHAELLSDDHIRVMARLGITASMQPMFDCLWGGRGGMYEQRLGASRARAMNRVRDLLAGGVEVAFGSDSPVTPLGPWAAVLAAVHHSAPDQRVSTAAAFSAHTRAGWRAIGDRSSGSLTAGSAAHLAVWSTDLPVDDGLPILEPDGPLPACDATMVAGRVVHDRGVFH